MGQFGFVSLVSQFKLILFSSGKLRSVAGRPKPSKGRLTMPEGKQPFLKAGALSGWEMASLPNPLQ